MKNFRKKLSRFAWPRSRLPLREGRPIAKPMRGLGSGVFEIALPFRGDAFRLVYAVQLAEAVWVIHAFQKKSKHGEKTSQHEIELIRDRLKRLREMLR